MERTGEPGATGNPLDPPRPGEIRVLVNGPDGLPVPRGWIRIAPVDPTGGGGGGLGTFSGVGSHNVAPRSPGSELWIEFLRPCDREGTPLPFGAVVLAGVPREPGEITLTLPRGVRGAVRHDWTPRDETVRLPPAE